MYKVSDSLGMGLGPRISNMSLSDAGVSLSDAGIPDETIQRGV